MLYVIADPTNQYPNLINFEFQAEFDLEAHRIEFD